ncbi:hypothetical protein LZC95_45655 [Pendulispora brunnea]|uniref:Uncharacterized protein n=1 Tax=Pendulispora brunnea TaxID=2905690 RepID=A0ABZ2K8N8_9BACT
MKRHRGLMDQRGASLTEYVLILAAVLCAVGVAYKLLGKKVGHQAAHESNTTFHGETAEPTASSSPENGGLPIAGKSSIASKASIDNGAVTRARALATDVKTKVNEKIHEAANADLEDFSLKKMARWLAIVIAALGLGVGYTVYRRGRAEATTADNDPDATGPQTVRPPTAVRAAPPNAAPTKYTD